VNADGKYPETVPPDAKDTRDPIAQPQLFHLAEDPSEKRNLAQSHPVKFNELSALLARYRSQGYSRPGWQAAE
jgi:hypothetical protein